MEIIKNFLKFLLGICIAALAVIISIIGGWFLRYAIWIFCFLCTILKGEGPITNWICSHDAAMLLICSIIFLPLFIIGILRDSGDRSSGGNYKSSGGKRISFDEELRDMNRNSFVFIDCSGSYRRWGDDFIDHKGNWCQWGSGFYDYDDNYIHWGGTYKDSSGAYRHWGDNFVDAAGNYVRCP